MLVDNDIVIDDEDDDDTTVPIGQTSIVTGVKTTDRDALSSFSKELRFFSQFVSFFLFSS